MKRPLELDRADGQKAFDDLVAVTELTWQDMGEVRATFRAWPGTTFWVVASVLTVASVAWSLVVEPLALFAVGTFGAFGAAFVASGAVERTRVCEHGLILGFRTRSRYVVPWSTVDPGRVRVVRRVGMVGRLPDALPSSPHYRLGIFTTSALAVNGLDTAITGWWAVPGLLGVKDALRPGTQQRGTPFAWWLLGTRSPAELAREIEAAMVADGYPAAGLAARAVAQAHTMRLRPGTYDPLPTRAATDRVLGVDGPSLTEVRA